jgi:hypothetical protein
LLSPDFFLDTTGRVAKMNAPALQDFNAGAFAFRSPNLRLSQTPIEKTIVRRVKERRVKARGLPPPAAAPTGRLPSRSALPEKSSMIGPSRFVA